MPVIQEQVVKPEVENVPANNTEQKAAEPVPEQPVTSDQAQQQ